MSACGCDVVLLECFDHGDKEAECEEQLGWAEIDLGVRELVLVCNVEGDGSGRYGCGGFEP